jgi:hypothetical protein
MNKLFNFIKFFINISCCGEKCFSCKCFNIQCCSILCEKKNETYDSISIDEEWNKIFKEMSEDEL